LSVMIRSVGYFSGFPSFFIHCVSHHSVNVSKLCGRLGLSYFWNVITTCLIYWDVAKINGICFQLSNSIQTRSAQGTWKVDKFALGGSEYFEKRIFLILFPRRHTSRLVRT
jgi:hypothetical protein